MSLYKRKNSPHWWTEFVVKGRRIARSTGCTSRRDAEQFERALRDQVAREVRAPRPAGQTLDAACGQYWIEHGKRLRDARNVARNLRSITDHIDPSLPLADLSTRHVTELVTAMRAAGRGEIAINRTVTTLQGVHNRAAKSWEWTVKVIAWKGHKSRERSRTSHLTHDQAVALLGALPEHIAAVVRFLLLTGLRRNEAFGLTWDAVQAGSVTVRVKGGSIRRLTLSAEAVDLLANQPRTSRFVFDTTNWRRAFDEARTAIGYPALRWHDLRHSHATWLGQAGTPLDVIRDALGHSSIAVTQKYRHVVGSEVQDALQKLPTLSPNTGKVSGLKRS